MRSLAALCASAVLLSGCTTGDPAAPQTSSTPTPSAPSGADTATPSPGTADAAPAPEPEPPEQNDCYRFPYAELAHTTTDRDPVPCADRHNAVTIHVGRVDRLVGDVTATQSEAVQQRVADDCRRRLARTLGGSRATRRLSRFHSVWFLPAVEQRDRGADWYRCDLVAFAADEKLAELPPPRRLAGLLDRPAALSTYGLCGTAAPGSRRFERVICDRRHSWRAVATIRISDATRYPGVRAVRSAGEDRCRDLVRSMSSTPLRFRYGWEWPTREQWARGQHHGFCWAPAPS